MNTKIDEKKVSKKFEQIIFQTHSNYRIDDFSFGEKEKVSDNLNEIIHLFKSFQINENEHFEALIKGNIDIKHELHNLKQINNEQLKEIEGLKLYNKRTLEMLLENTFDKKVKSISISFMILFFFSLIFYYFFNYEFIKIFWSKIGIILSTSIFFISYFIGHMINDKITLDKS